MASESVEEYIEAIFRIGGEIGSVSTCRLAGRLGVAPASVTTMLARLSRDGLVKHIPYKGITLTDTGHAMAASMIRRHRLSERLLTDILGMPWESVHEAACKLEHVITGEMEERAYQALGEPERCPHGHLLEGNEDGGVVILHNSPVGKRMEIVKITDESEETLRKASEIGLIPSAKITINAIEDDCISIDIDNCKYSLDKSFAECIWVRPQS